MKRNQNKVIATREDVIKLASSYRAKTTDEEMDDVLRCLIEYMEIKIREDSVPAFHLPNLGYMYTTLKHSRKKMSIDKADIHLERYERIFKMHLKTVCSRLLDIFIGRTIFENYLVKSKMTLEEYENKQNLDDN